MAIPRTETDQSHTGEAIAPADQRSDGAGRVLQNLRACATAEDVGELERFGEVFCRSLPPGELDERSGEDLAGAALTLWHHVRRRRPNAPTIEIFNPTVEDDGWHTPHTVIVVVNDDMPFLVDSTTAFLAGEGLTIHRIVHPVVDVRRDEEGVLTAIRAPGEETAAIAESWMLIEIDRRSNEEAAEALRGGLAGVLAQVRLSVADWRPMMRHLVAARNSLSKASGSVPGSERREALALLDWIADDHFTFLGYREYRIQRNGGAALRYRSVPESSLGILRDPELRPLGIARGRESLPPDVQTFIESQNLLMITKSAISSKVHRTAPMDSIGVKVLDDHGNVVGEDRFVGLFTSTVYSRSIYDIPLIRQRVSEVLKRSSFSETGHAYKALEHILETLPRDELFQIGTDELLQLGLGILNVEERQRTGVFVRRDPFERGLSCLVYVPRERYDTALRFRVQNELESAFAGTTTSFATQVSDSPLARIHLVIKTTPGQVPDIARQVLEKRVAAVTRSWEDHLRDVLLQRHDEEIANTLADRYGASFPSAYREENAPAQAVDDVEMLESVRKSGTLSLYLYAQPEEPGGQFGLKLYHPGRPVPLSDLLPTLEKLGFRVLSEQPFRIKIASRPAGKVWIHDLTVEQQDHAPVDLAAIQEPFQEAFKRIWFGEAEDDGFGQLVVLAGLGWREVAVLRAVGRYLRQTGIPFSQEYMQSTLARNPTVARDLFSYFAARFAPGGLSDDESAALRGSILGALDAVESLDEDRILRRFLNVIDAMLRTNFFQRTAHGEPKACLSFKLDSQSLDGLPLPRPHVEIFVYGPRMEGIHLRGGKVARGGIRWSDRREDFRTEILGLMKAQMVKNAVIVPVGAKGGFVLKRPPVEGTRAALNEEAVACYRMFIAGLLDLTDNRDGETIVPPKDVRRYDDDDPYLVVAADKGTASFSDVANQVAATYGFWLGDAFASGGAEGYDHKEMGITARGAWESVKRHFRELGQDVQSEPITVVGVGDMSGDVFGNGMLQSDQIRLIGAFNHRHIFVDPTPDPRTSFVERERLFAAEASAWTDYDSTAFSTGGAVFSRSAKSVELSDEIRERLGIKAERLAPNALIRALLAAPVDLLWFGGIGCFVRARGERDTDVGDHANDAVRIDARELRCRVIGEGANLALTQKARVEFARAGGRLNTDAVDNAAGVDCSDHEVNIKIVLNDVVARREMTARQRGDLLAEMTDEVAELVLRNNYLQTLAISVAEARSVERFDEHVRLMQRLERAGRLDRTVEDLPDDAALEERGQAGQGLTRPEIAVLLAYAKTTLFADLLESSFLDDQFLFGELLDYMPTPMREAHADAIARHRLRRELIATRLANSLVNRGGPEFVNEIQDYTGATIGGVARAYSMARYVFGHRALWHAIESLDNRVDSGVQIEMLITVGRLLEHGTVWFLRNRPALIDPEETWQTADTFARGVAELATRIQRLTTEDERQQLAKRREKLEGVGVPEELAHAVAVLEHLYSSCDIVEVSRLTGHNVADVGAAYYALGKALQLPWLHRAAEAIRQGDHWQHRAVSAVISDLYGQQRALTLHALRGAPDRTCDDALAHWMDDNASLIQRITELFDELNSSGPLDLAMLVVANRELRSLIAG